MGSDDLKLFVVLMVAFIGIPLVGFAYSEHSKQNCRIELSKAGKPIDEIKELCK